MKFSIRRSLFYQAILMIASTLTYAACLRYPVMESWDDKAFITDALQYFPWSWDNLVKWFTGCPYDFNYIPLASLSYMIDFNAFGMDPTAMRAHNLFWHALAVLAVYQCCAAFKIRPTIAFAIALIFAVHPQKTESVACLAQRKDMMCAAFYFWSLYFYLRRDRGKINRYLPLPLFIASALSKPMGITLPLVFMALDAGRDHWKGLLKTAARLWAYWLVAAIFAVITVKTQVTPENPVDWVRQLWVVPRNVIWYLEKTFIPVDLCPIYPRARLTTVGAVILAAEYLALALAGYVVWARYRETFHRRVLPLTCCWLAALAPVVGVTQLGVFDYADRFNYIPSFFPLLGVGLALEGLVAADRLPVTARKAAIVGVSLYIVWLAFYANVYTRTWESFRSMIAYSALHDPPNFFVVGIEGRRQLAAGNYEKTLAAADYLFSTREDWMCPSFIVGGQLMATYLRGQVAYARDDAASTVAELSKIEPKMASTNFFSHADQIDILTKLGSSELSLGQKARAAERFRKIATLSTSDSEAFQRSFYTGLAAYVNHDFAAAIGAFEKALALKPDDAHCALNLKQAREKARRP